MGLIDDKKSIFTGVAALTSLKDDITTAQRDVMESINNVKEVIPFLLDLSKTLVGSNALNMILGNLFAKFVRNIEPDLKNALILQLSQYNSDQLISDTTFKDGYSIPLNKIDVYNKLKIDPNSNIGLSVYDTTSENFDYKAYSAIVNPNTDVTYLNIILNYNETTDELKITPSNTSQTIEDFITEYICNLKLINEKEFITNILNIIYGIKTTNENKTVNKIKDELIIDSMLNKILIDEDDLDPTDDELRQIDDNSQNLKNGLAYIDLGCGYESNEITTDILLQTISAITSSNDPYTIGNSFNNLINSGNTSNDDVNILTKKDNFLKRIIEAFQIEILKVTTLSPQMRTMYIVLSGIKNNGDISKDDIKEDIKANKNLFKCLSKKIASMINEFVFNFVKKELQDLIIPVVKKIAIEKLNQYVGLLKSLVKF